MNLGNIKVEDFTINSGYDRRMNYSFMTVYDNEGDIVYSNIEEPNMFDFVDFDYFENLARERFNLDLSDITLAIDLFRINSNMDIERYKELLKENDLDKLTYSVSY